MTETAIDILQIVFADIILSGDNALVIGMAAAGLSPDLRKRAIAFGMALAAGLRILFAALATILLQIPGILFFGGLLLSVVCWRFYRDLEAHGRKAEQGVHNFQATKGGENRNLWGALITITFADVSMSIDNVVAVAAIARDNTALLVFGLALAILFMAVFATLIMRILARFRWLSWLGLLFLIYLTVRMLYDGWPEMAGLVAGLWSAT